MSEHKVSVIWQRTTPTFGYNEFSRDHVWKFEGGQELRGSSAPQFRGNPDLTDPEEAFVAALSSCHMLTFLAIAATKRLTVDSYQDDAVGTLEKNEKGRLAMTRVVLRPRVVFGSESTPSADELQKMHQKAHAGCFIANSVTSDVVVEPPL